MDYKYIEQLLSRYWECETSLEEEQILRAFFCQKDVPAHLARYVPLFTSQRTASEEGVSPDFEARLEVALRKEQMRGSRSVRPMRWVVLRRRLSPMLQAAAIVAVCLTIGGAAERAFTPREMTTSTTVENAYVKSEQVADMLSPAQQRTETTATVEIPVLDTLARSTVPQSATTE